MSASGRLIRTRAQVTRLSRPWVLTVLPSSQKTATAFRKRSRMKETLPPGHSDSGAVRTAHATRQPARPISGVTIVIGRPWVNRSSRCEAIATAAASSAGCRAPRAGTYACGASSRIAVNTRSARNETEPPDSPDALRAASSCGRPRSAANAPAGTPPGAQAAISAGGESSTGPFRHHSAGGPRSAPEWSLIAAPPRTLPTACRP